MDIWRINFPVLDFVIALLIGALVGIEREKKQEGQEPTGVGGLRTFILFAQAGAVAAWLSRELNCPWIFIATGMMVTAIIITGYYLHLRTLPQAFGMTTEIAAIVVFLLGGTALFGYKELAVALAVTTSAVLAYKRPLHGIVGKLGQEDITAGVKLLFATFIILPVLPDRTIDPWGAINPYKMWWLVILIASISLIGYVASRWLGTKRGTSLTGFFGGLVSSTAVTLTFAKRSRDEAGTAGISDALATGLMLSWVIMFVRILVEVAVVYRPMVLQTFVPMLTMGLLATVIAVVFYRRSTRHPSASNSGDVPLKNPFSLIFAVKFALIFAVVMLLVKLTEHYVPGQGIYVVSALAGLPDVDAIALSMAQHAKDTGQIEVAVTAITIGVASNTVAKCALVLWIGTRELKMRTVLATVVVIAGAVLSLTTLYPLLF